MSAPFGDVRVITTHLEYYSELQRRAQIERLRAIYAEGHGHARAGKIVDTRRRAVPHVPAAGVDDHDRRLQPRARRSAARADGARPSKTARTPPRRRVDSRPSRQSRTPARSSIYEKDYPGEPELHCDFIFVSEDLPPACRAVRVDRETQAADHQPVILTLD